MCMALGVAHLDDIAKEIESLFKLLTKPKESLLDKINLLPKLGQFASWMPKVKSGRGECQEIIMKDPDLTKLPVITCWPKDGGPFITLPVIHTKDPNTGTRNVGMYRMQVFEKTMTGMHWHKHKVSAKHFNEYKKLNKRMPVAVALGGDVEGEVVVAGLVPGIVKASRATQLVPDTTLDAALHEEYDMVVLPGGMPGAQHLKDDARIIGLIQKMAATGRYTAAICAAPTVLAAAGVLSGKTATGYPGFLEKMDLNDVTLSTDAVVRDGRVITSRGPGTAMDFALSLVEILSGLDVRRQIESALVRA